MKSFKKNKGLFRVVCFYAIFSFLSSAIFPCYAQEIFLPAPNQFVHLSEPYSFPALKGLKFDPATPFQMQFIVDSGNDKAVTQEEAAQLIRYFLAGLTIPEDELWVNMSPYEKDKIITPNLASTDLGRDLLGQDYILKQISSSLTYPESSTGKDFWQKTYEEVFKVAKTTNLPVNTFNKIWIVPDKAVVYENAQIALTTEATLKAMLEEDYLALKQNVSDIQKQKKNLKEDTIEQINKVSSNVMRETILPKINQEVNAGKNFATLRQIYYSLILATWFKEKFKESIYKYYIDKGKTKGIDLADKDAKDKIYNLYVEAFKKGIYNYIKTDTEPQTRRKIKRQYFSGGLDWEITPILKQQPLTDANTPKAISLAGVTDTPDRSVTIKVNKAEGQKGEAGSPISAEGILKVLEAINANTVGNIDDIEAVKAKLSMLSASFDAITIAAAKIHNEAIALDEGTLKLSEAEARALYTKNTILQEILAKKRSEVAAKPAMRAEEVEKIINGINPDTINSIDDIEAIKAKLLFAPYEAINIIAAKIHNQVVGLDEGTAELPQKEAEASYKRNTVLQEILAKKRSEIVITPAPTVIKEEEVAAKSVAYSSWREFEEKELTGKEISQQKRNLSEPVKVAFYLDSFPADATTVLYTGVNRIIDSIFRLLDGNPNFAPTVIILGGAGRPGIQRFAAYLKSNPALGNAKYKVKLQENKLIINSREISVTYTLDFENINSWDLAGADYLVMANRQGYIDRSIDKLADSFSDKKFQKESEESYQADTIKKLSEKLPDLKFIIIAPEEDKSEVFGEVPLVNRINTNTALKPDARKVVLAEPVTAVASIMAKVAEEAVKAANPQAKVEVATVEAIRTDRQGNRLIDTLKTEFALALNRVLGKPEANINRRALDTAVISGANEVNVILRVSGYMAELTAEQINEAFRKASKDKLKGIIDYKGEPTASSFEVFNQHPLVFMPAMTEVRRVAQAGAAPYRTIILRGFYSESGYAKQVLDLITEAELFKGNKATPTEAAGLEAPAGTIPATPNKIRLQVVPDGETIPIILNSIGRIAKNTLRRLWNDPNFKIVAINGVRTKTEEAIAVLTEYDVVYGEAPFSVEVTQDKRNFKFTDKEERITPVNADTILNDYSLKDGVQRIALATVYGNLFVEHRDGKITLMRLHGEEVSKINVINNPDGTFTAQGKLRSGTTIRLTYAAEGDSGVNLLSAGVKKQEIIPITNIRADESAYKLEKGEDKNSPTFLRRIQDENRRVGQKMIAQLPWVNRDTLVLEASGQLTEAAKLIPFYLAGTGKGLISAPAKAVIGEVAADATIVPAVNTETLLSAWKALQTGSCASCTTNAATTGIKPVLDILRVISGYFDTVHAITNTQGKQFGEPGKNLERSLDARTHIIATSTGASTELAKALPVLSGLLSGVAFRVGNDDGSLVYYDLQVEPGPDGKIPTAEEINAAVKLLTESPQKEGGLKGSLGYGVYNTSLEIVGSEFGGIFDPSKTQVNQNTKTVSLGIWYDNERGYDNQLVILALLMGLQQRELNKTIDIVAQDVVAEPGAHTGRISVASAKQSGATGVIAGSGQFRNFEEQANRFRQKPFNVNAEINKALKKALEVGVGLPILNVYLSETDQATGRVNDAINQQVSEALKDIAPEDIMRLVISLEIVPEKEKPFFSEYLSTDYLEAARNAVAGYVARTFLDNAQKEKPAYIAKFGQTGYDAYIADLKKLVKGATEYETLQNYANLLGANVAAKVRILAKVNDKEAPIPIEAFVRHPQVDGLIVAAKDTYNNYSFEWLSRMSGEISKEITNNLEKREELNKRLSPRFLLVANLGSSLLDPQKLSTDDYFGANPQHLQLAIAPAAVQINELSAVQRGEKLAQGNLPAAKKVPARVLLQAETLAANEEGFVNLSDAVTKLGVHDILIAHSEQLELTGITDSEIAKVAEYSHYLKGKGALTGTVLVAVGETLSDYRAGRSKEIVRQQALNRLSGLTAQQVAETVIPYEPRWAIGTGLTPNLQEIQEMHQAIRNTVKAKFGVEASQKVRIIYGGSFSLKKTLDPTGEKTDGEMILGLKDVDGALIGTASIMAKDFGEMVSLAQKVYDQKRAKWGIERKMYIAGNHKALAVKDSYEEFVNLVKGADRRKVEVALGPELNRIPELSAVYTKDPLKDIVVIDQLRREEIEGKVWYLRADLNLPVNDLKAQPNNPDTWEITSDARIRAALPDAKYILENGGVPVLVTHFEPKGKNLSGPQSVNFMAPQIKKAFQKYLGMEIEVVFVNDILGSVKQNALIRALENIKKGKKTVVLLENVRLNKEIAKLEKADKDTPEDIAARNKLATQLYSGPNVGGIINVGIGVMHRNQGTVTGEAPGVPRLSGISLREELIFGTEAIRNAQHPIAVIFGGGAKIADKIPMLKNIILDTLTKGDKIFVYGGAAVVFSLAMDPNFEPGLSRSMIDEATLQTAREIIELAEEEGVEIVLPVDFVVADNLPADEDQTVTTSIVPADKVPASKGIYDIGPQEVARFEKEAVDEKGKSKFGLIIWNGPAGVFEYEQFRTGSEGIGKVVAKVTKSEKNPDGAVTILGGGDTGYMAELLGIADKVTSVSNGGGAWLELLEGKDLPGVKVLRGKAGVYSYHLNPNIEKGFVAIRDLVSDYASRNADLSVVSSPLTAHEAITSLIQTRDSGYMAAVNSVDTAKLVAKPEAGKFAPGHDVFEAVRDNKQSIIAVNVVSYNQIEGHIRAAIEQNAILILEVARSQLGYALNENKVMEYINKAIEKIKKETGKEIPPIVVHGDHIQYTEASFKARDILKAEYERVNGEGSFKEVTDINAIDQAILENVSKKLQDNTAGERKKVTEINERLIKAGFTSIAIDASTLYDEYAGDLVLDYYASKGTAAEKLVVKLEKEFALPLEWGVELLKLDPATAEGKTQFEALKAEIENNMMDRDRSKAEIDTMLKELEAAFGVLVRQARESSLNFQEVIAAYDKVSREVAEATIAGKIQENVLSTLTEKQKLLLLPSSNAQETAYQLNRIQELLNQYQPGLVGHFGIEVEVGHVDRKYPNPKRQGKMEAKMTHPLAVRVMGEYFKKEGLSFDLIATNNGSGHGTDFDKKTLTPISQVGKISPFLTRELQKEAVVFGASIAQHGTSGSDMDELTELSKTGVIKFNIATNYQQIILNVLSLLDGGLEGEKLSSQVESDKDALMSGLHKDARAKILGLAKEIKDNSSNAEVKENDSIFNQFLKLTYAWGVSKKKIKDASTDKDIATLMAKEFKRVFGQMDSALLGLDTASSPMNLANLQAQAGQSADSRGKPTVKVVLELGGIKAEGDVPAGASKGEDEAKTVSVEQAIKNINEVIISWLKESGLDLKKNGYQALVVADNYLMKRIDTLGANATVPVSRALWRMAAKIEGLELAQHIAKYVPEAVSADTGLVRFYMNIYNGGLHALKAGETLGKDRIDIQEIMIVPVSAKAYREALEMGDKIDFELKKILSEEFTAGSLTRADEAGFSVKGLGDSTKAIEHVFEAIKKAGYTPGKDVKLALDVAATSFYKDGKYAFGGFELTSDEMIRYYTLLAESYQGILLSIEDGLAENDWEGWQKLTKAMKELGIRTIGDDIFVTQLPRLSKGIEMKAATDILIKVNQNGTVLGTLEVIKRAKAAGMGWVVSHRSGETLDDSIADLAYATNAFGLKTGDPQPDYDFGKNGVYAGQPLVRRAKYLRMIELQESSSPMITGQGENNKRGETKKLIYSFGEGKSEGVSLIASSEERKKILGGKGAGMQEMSAMGIPVPPGFTIATTAGIHFLEQGSYPEGLKEEIAEQLLQLETQMGKKLGDPNDPLLVSVRSGSKFSMPGMMDTILNLGLNDSSVEGLARKTNNPRFAYDSYRRFIEGFSKIVLGIKEADEKFREILSEVKEEEGIEVSPRTDAQLSAEALKDKLIPRYKQLILKETGQEFSDDSNTHLDLAIKAVFNSWNSQRAKDYREVHKIPADLGTACSIVAMVFGNTGPNSGTGVYFTRDNTTGENRPFGDFLANAQGDDVVSGNFPTLKIHKGELKEKFPEIYRQLIDVGQKLEQEYNDMQDIEFTIQEGTLYILQTRTGKRTGPAAIKIAVDMAKEGLITKKEAILRVSPLDLAQLLYPRLDPQAKVETIARGAAASLGVSSGKIVFDTKSVLEYKKRDERVILVRIETSPEDFKGMVNADGILTARGGETSHAAIVCKSERKIGVFGAEELVIDYKNKTIKVGDKTLKEGDIITIDANAKKVYLGAVPLVPGGLTEEAKELLSWADSLRRLGIRANADTPEQARKAREFGAEGIGLLRIEHWIQVNEELQRLFQLWILTDDAGIKKEALSKIEPLLKKDMKEVLKIMEGYPVIVRTLDPPLHEFLPHDEDKIQDLAKELNLNPAQVKEKIDSLKEANPMLGHRGVRLGITAPEITKMQVRAIISAGAELVKEGVRAIPEIMIPVVAFDKELINQEQIVRETAKEVMESYGVSPEELPYKFGTMIELPSAALSAGELAKIAEFFSFGTNDLTQTTTGFSRDDTGKLLDFYVAQGHLAYNPFVTLHPRVAELMAKAVREGRKTKGNLEIGICGEHGRDPESIKTSDEIGLDYVSPSGDGILIARLVAAQSEIERRDKKLKIPTVPLSEAYDELAKIIDGYRQGRGILIPDFVNFRQNFTFAPDQDNPNRLRIENFLPILLREQMLEREVPESPTAPIIQVTRLSDGRLQFKQVTPQPIFYTDKSVGSSSLTGKGERRVVDESTDNLGGINLEGIDVDAAPASIPVNMPMFDFQNLEGLTFRIIRIESIPNLNVFFGIVAKEEEEGREKLAYLKN